MSLNTNKRNDDQLTDETDGSAYEGVEVAAGCVDVGLHPGTVLPSRQTAEEDGLPDHDLSTHTEPSKVFTYGTKRSPLLAGGQTCPLHVKILSLALLVHQLRYIDPIIMCEGGCRWTQKPAGNY